MEADKPAPEPESNYTDHYAGHPSHRGYIAIDADVQETTRNIPERSELPLAAEGTWSSLATFPRGFVVVRPC